MFKKLTMLILILCLMSFSVPAQGLDDVITSLGYTQKALVTLLDKMTGRIWIPAAAFNDAGNAAFAAVGGTARTGMAFDPSTDEYIDVSLALPKDVDLAVALSCYAYWSSDGTSGYPCNWGILYLASAAGDDMGAAGTAVTVSDPDNTTADDLNISPVISIPASTVASTAEMLNLAFYRDADASADSLAEDAEFYGLLITYQPKPVIYP